MKTKDKIRRIIFTISAEGAVLFEWSIWSTLLTLLIGLPIAISVLQSLVKGLFAAVITGMALFAVSFIILAITDGILRTWPFKISDDELEFESSYISGDQENK